MGQTTFGGGVQFRAHKTLSVAKEPLHFGGHFGHLHKMVLIEPPYVLFLEVAVDNQNSLAFQLGCLTGMGKVTICISALFSLASEIGTDRIGHVLREDVGRDPKSFFSFATVSAFMARQAFFFC